MILHRWSEIAEFYIALYNEEDKDRSFLKGLTGAKSAKIRQDAWRDFLRETKLKGLGRFVALRLLLVLMVSLLHFTSLLDRSMM